MDHVSMGRNRPRVGVYRERPGSDIVKQGVLKKVKVQLHIMLLKKKYFILRSTSSSGPARLDYFENEDKFRANKPPKKSIPLYTCFNINKKVDSKHKFGITIFLETGSFSVVADCQTEQESWLNNLLEYQNEYLLDGEEPRVHYDYVWQGTVKQKSPTSCSKILGPYRLCLLEAEKSVSLVKLGESMPSYTFQFSSIRRCGHTDNFFFMEVGRSAVTGSGDIWMQMDDTHTAQSMHDVVMTEMASSRNSQSDHFRRRSNTSSSTYNTHRNVHDHEPFHRKRAQSESQHNQGSPRHNRASTVSLQPQQRPRSTVVYMNNQSSVQEPVPTSSSPLSPYDQSFLDDDRMRTSSVGSRTSHSSKHSDVMDGQFYQNTAPSTPVMTPENSFSSLRSTTPEAISECPNDDEDDSDENGDDEPPSHSDYLPMTPGQSSMTPSPTNSQAERLGQGSDYLSMTPSGHSGAPSPTRHMDRPGSAGSEVYELSATSEGYMDMQPGSQVNSPSACSSYMDMQPGSQVNSPSACSSYMDMTPTSQPPSGGNGYIEMTPGMRVPVDPGPGYVIMDGARVRTSAAPIPIRSSKDPGYMDMGVLCPSSQTLPTVKEGGSGEAYLPMSPSGQSPVSSAGLKPAKVFSYLSDDSMSGEFPKRAYSVGSRPVAKPAHRNHPPHEPLRKQPLDSNKSSSAPHLIIQKNRSQQIEHLSSRSSYLDTSYGNVSPLSQSVKSDDCDSFVEMDFYRPRTASDSYGCRPRSSSFSKQFMNVQGHRPRSSSHGQASKYERKMSKLAVGLRTDSFDSVRTTSQSDVTNKSKRSQESLGKFSTSSRNSSSESLKRLHEAEAKKHSLTTEYMDMGFDKRKTPSPNIHSISSPSADPIGYVDMTLGSSVPKSLSRGMSPSSSSQSISQGSSPASINYPLQGEKSGKNEAKVIKASGKVIQKQMFTNPSPGTPSNSYLKVASVTRVKKSGRSPAGSGRESEDESYVPFRPSGSGLDDAHRSHGASHETLHRGHVGIKIQHGYSKSLDSAMKSPETEKVRTRLDSKSIKMRKEDKVKPKSDDEQKSSSKSAKLSKKENDKKSPKNRSKSQKKDSPVRSPEEKQLAETIAKECSPSLEQVEQIPKNDLFSDNYSVDTSDNQPHCSAANACGAAGSVVGGTVGGTVGNTADKESGYMDFCPGFEVPLSPTLKPILNTVVSTASPKTSTPSEATKKTEKGTPKSAERDYFDIDMTPVARPSTDSTAVTVEPSAVDESDYMDADPSNMFLNTGVASPIAKSAEDGNFSYMDFNPSESSDSKSGNEAVIKAPTRVQSFLSHSPETDSKDKRDLDLVVKVEENQRSSEVRQEIGAVANGDKSGCANGCEGGDSKGSDLKLKKNIGETSVKKTGSHVGNIAEVTLGKSDKKPVISDVGKENKAPPKFVIKHTLNVRDTPEPVQDEGYCDLDFSEATPSRKHNRSGSSSSTNSERSRKFMLENTSPMVEDDIPCPETPVSYICDDSDVSVHSDASGRLDSSSSYKQSGTKSQATSKNSSVSSLSGGSTGQLNEEGRKPLQSPRNVQSNMQFYDAQMAAAVSRQCSVPGSVSIYSPKTGSDRCRKASGPAGFPMGSSKSGNGSPQCGVGGQVSKRPALETVAPSQELLKQKSMPCMNVPTNGGGGRANPLPTECLIKETVQSRHSFSDLSQYEEMTFPGHNLEGPSTKEKSSSQQQLAETVCETKLNYAELDIGGSTENVDERSPRVNKSRHPSSVDDLTQSAPPVSYAEIDYEKTAENSKTVNKDVKFSL